MPYDTLTLTGNLTGRIVWTYGPFWTDPNSGVLVVLVKIMNIFRSEPESPEFRPENPTNCKLIDTSAGSHLPKWWAFR